MERTQISLTRAERELLDNEAARTGRSLASLIRDAVNTVYGKSRTAEEDLNAMRLGYGAWTDREGDSATWVAELRSGRRLDSAP